MSEKIQSMHTEREAYVYIRQSTMHQVRTRLEGQRRQQAYRTKDATCKTGRQVRPVGHRKDRPRPSCRSQGHPSRAYWATRPIAPTEQCANHHVF